MDLTRIIVERPSKAIVEENTITPTASSNSESSDVVQNVPSRKRPKPSARGSARGSANKRESDEGVTAMVASDDINIAQHSNPSDIGPDGAAAVSTDVANDADGEMELYGNDDMMAVDGVESNEISVAILARAVRRGDNLVVDFPEIR